MSKDTQAEADRWAALDARVAALEEIVSELTGAPPWDDEGNDDAGN